MAKIKRTYALSSEAIKKLEELALNASYERRERVALGAMLEELIMRASSAAALKSSGKRVWDSAGRKRRGEIAQTEKQSARIGNVDDLDDLIG